MFLVISSKIISYGFINLTLLGGALSTGFIFSSLLLSLSSTPDLEETLLGYSLLAFALVETYTFLVFLLLAVIWVMH